MRLIGSNHARLEARVTHADSQIDPHGKYALAEIGWIETVGDTEYVTSLVAGARRDEMPRDVRNQRDRDAAKRARAREDAKSSD